MYNDKSCDETFLWPSNADHIDALKVGFCVEEEKQENWEKNPKSNVKDQSGTLMSANIGLTSLLFVMAM